MSAVTDDLGRGLGPVLVAAMISRLGSRRAALNAALLGFFPCALMQAALSLTLRRDEAAVQARLAARAKRMRLASRDVERNATSGGGGGLRPTGSLQLGGRGAGAGAGAAGGGGGGGGGGRTSGDGGGMGDGAARKASSSRGGGSGGFVMREVLVRRQRTQQDSDTAPE